MINPIKGVRCDCQRLCWNMRSCNSSSTILEIKVGFAISIRQYDHLYFERPWTQCFKAAAGWLSAVLISPVTKEISLAPAADNTRLCS